MVLPRLAILLPSVEWRKLCKLFEADLLHDCDCRDKFLFLMWLIVLKKWRYEGNNDGGKQKVAIGHNICPHP